MKHGGEKEVQKALDKYKKTAPRALAAALYQEGVAIMGKSVRQCPVDVGTLHKSHYVAPPDTSSRNPKVELGYGTKYGVYVHERTDLKHTVGKPKFLSDPMNDARASYTTRLAMRTKSNIDKGVEMVSTQMPTKPATPKTSFGPKRRKK